MRLSQSRPSPEGKLFLSPQEIQLLADAISDRLASYSNNDVLLDINEAAKLLTCSVAHLERLTKAGSIPSIKLGRLRRFRRAELLSFRNDQGGAA